MLYIKDLKGVAAVEFALIAPMLIFLLIGTIDYGMYMNDTMKVENTTRAAAAYLFEGGEEDNLEDDVYLPSPLGLTASNIATKLATQISYYCECADGTEADCDLGCADDVDPDSDDGYIRRYVEITLNMEREPLISYPGLSGAKTIAGFVRLQVE